MIPHAQDQAAEPHPSDDDLARYRADELVPEQEAEIRRHLAECRECAEEILDQAALDAIDEAPPMHDFELESAWRRQRRRLFPGDEPEATSRRTYAKGLRVLAAALAVAVLATWIVVQQLELARLRAPEVNPPRMSLDPVGSLRQPAGRAEVLAIPADARWSVLVLNPSRRNSEYRVELRSADGRSVWTLDTGPSESGAIVLLLARDQLPPGEYRILLSGLEAGDIAVVDEFVVMIRWL